MKFRIIGILVSSVLAGCAGLPTPEEAAKADYGLYPSNYEGIVKSYVNLTFKDPDSVKYQGITSPEKSWLGNVVDGATYGYMVCATLNGKNSYGAYVGYSTDALLIRNGAVVMYVENGDWYGRQICK